MKRSGIIIAFLAAVIGVMVLTSPQEFIKSIVIILGIGAVIDGIINFAVVRTLIDDPYFKKNILIRGLLSIVIGFAAVSLPLVLAATVWTIMLYILGVYLILSALLEIFAVFKLKAAGILVGPYVIEIIISILLSVLLFAIPGRIGVLIVRILGILLIALAVFIARYSFKNAPLVVDADEVSDDDGADDDGAGAAGSGKQD